MADLQQSVLRPPSSDTSTTSANPDLLPAYVTTLVQESELSELILQLEALSSAQSGTRAPSSSTSPESSPALDPGLQELVRNTGLELGNPESVRRAILALGQRLEALRKARAGSHLPELPRLAERDVAGLARAMLPAFEETRMRCSRPEQLEPMLHQTVDEALEVYRRNQPPRTPEEVRWWGEVGEALHKRMAPGYARIAEALTRLEDNPITGALLRFRLLMGMIFALVGLVTVPMPISTPLVMVALGLLGYFIVYPAWLNFVTQPLHSLAENLAGEGALIERLASDEPWPEESFTLRGVTTDLIPILEGERRAGRADEESLRQAISGYFSQIEPHYKHSSTRSPRYFKHLQEFAETQIARRYALYAASRAKLESRPIGRFWDQPRLAALLVTFCTLPLSLGASRMTPLPAAIDFPLMAMIFAALGWYLPRIMPGTLPARDSLIEELSSHQGELDQLP